jgi:penicillin-binding protein 1C
MTLRCRSAFGGFLVWTCLLGGLTPAFARIQPFAEVRTAWHPSEAYLTDRHGEVIHALRVDYTVRRLPWTRLEEFSPALIKAVIAAEDRRFHEHRGVDFRALAAAALDYLVGRSRRGASTISMQVAAMLDDHLTATHGRRTLGQKLRQLRAALELETHWRKHEILEAYLNRVGFRGEMEGVPAAALVWFDKRPSGLGEAESALLAALLPSPNAGTARIGSRACAIATASGFHLDCAELRRMASDIFGQAPRSKPGMALAPHLASRLVKTPGASVKTTLDATIQRLALNALHQQLQGLRRRNVRDGAALVVDNRRGDILAYVGSGGPASQAPQVDGVRALRQAGSTLKPFLYGLALEKRYLTAASILDDAPINLKTSTGLYIPQNYDRDFKGLVSTRTALASSLNVPAVRTLVMTGVEALRDRLRELGYLSITQDGEYYGFALALGSAEVSLMEQVNAYRALANGGAFSPLRVFPEEGGAMRPVMSPQAAFIVSDILSDRSGRAVSFGLDNPLTTRFWSAVKTGTSKDMRDNWCIGYSEKYTVGVWVGNFEGDAMHDVSGVTGAAPVWLEIMNELHEAASSEAPVPPEGVTALQVRFRPELEPERREWFIAGTETAVVQMNDASTSPPRIESPPDGAVLAIDPDIPERNQVIVFKTSLARPDASFVLDGVSIASAADAYKWRPAAGVHRLVLIGPDGQRFDQIDFEVRGPGP